MNPIPRHKPSHYHAQVERLCSTGELKKAGTTWPQLTSGNYVRPSIDGEQANDTGFARPPRSGVAA